MHDLIRRLRRLVEGSPRAATLVIVAVLVGVAYGGSLRNGFVWDDETLVVRNPHVADLSRWASYFVDPSSISTDPLIAKTYRPLQTLSFAVDRALWHGWPGGFHLTSLLLQVALGMAVFFLARGITGPAASAVAAVLVSVHPALSEGVLYLSARGGQLSALLGLVAAGLFLRVTRPFDAAHLASILATLLALLAKEPAVALPALLLLLQAGLGRPWPFRSRASWALHAPFAGVAALYVGLRHAVVGSMEVAPYWGGSLSATLLLQAKVFVVYLRLLIWPARLQGRYPVPDAASLDPATAMAILLNLTLVAVAFVALRRTGPWRLLGLAILWFYVSLLPVSNLVPIPGAMLGERFVVLTFAGMLALLAGAVAAIWPGERRPRLLGLAGLALAALTMAFVAADRRRTPAWRDDLVFFTLLSRQEPGDPVIQIRMAREEVNAGAPERAVSRLEPFVGRITGLPGAIAPLHFWYGVALLRTGRSVDASVQLRTVERLTGTLTTDLALALAEAAAGSGDLPGARAVVERALGADARNDALWNALGIVASMQGDAGGAAERFRKALEINPSNAEAATNLEMALRTSRQVRDL